jgi:hypothetical protein
MSQENLSLSLPIEQINYLKDFFRYKEDNLSRLFGDFYYTNIFPYLCQIIISQNPIYIQFIESMMDNFQQITTFYRITSTIPEKDMNIVDKMIDDIRSKNVQQCFARNPENGSRILYEDGSVKNGMLDEYPQFFLQLYNGFVINPELPRWMIFEYESIIKEVQKLQIELRQPTENEIKYYQKISQYSFYVMRNMTPFEWLNSKITFDRRYDYSSPDESE